MKYKYWVRHDGIDYAPGEEVPEFSEASLPFGPGGVRNEQVEDVKRASDSVFRKRK